MHYKQCEDDIIPVSPAQQAPVLKNPTSGPNIIIRQPFTRQPLLLLWCPSISTTMAIYHIILLKFKQNVSTADRENARAGLLALPSQIPAISSIKTGRKIKHPLDRDFDHGIIFVFNDEDALKSYADHKAHRDFLELAAPFTEDKLIFDICADE
ncbi:stress responsive A/B barrel domain-containing protein [Boletus coccyginus]|nr:stress responsive A/B barrel domain-containing protein [Boletus coccyginus]